MARRFFTSDLHFNSSIMIDMKIRSFKDVECMNRCLIDNINRKCNKDDFLIHLGDFIQYGNDRNFIGYKVNPSEFIDQINPQIINIEGNHDNHNKMKSICLAMRTRLGCKFPSVSMCHYPSIHPRAKNTFIPGDIHLHGHIHLFIDKNGHKIIPQKFFIDFKNKVLNVNLNCELWNYKPLSEDELIDEIVKFMKNNGNENGIINA